MCKYCSMKPKLYDTWYCYYESGIELAEGGWTSLYIGADDEGRVAMWGCGDGETNFYYPKFCPECGRRLRDDHQGT